MSSDKTIITKRTEHDNLIPVLTYINDLPRTAAISSSLSFFSVCLRDCVKNIRRPTMLSAQDETLCLSILDQSIGRYIAMKNCSPAARIELCQAVYHIMKKLSGENMVFLKDRVITICGEYDYRSFWNTFEDASSYEDIERRMSASLSSQELKYFLDFAVFFIALVVFYGCGDEFHERIMRLEKLLRIKYTGIVPLERCGLCLWPLDLSFVQMEEDARDACDEHRALLKAAQRINPHVKVQARIDSVLWSRDIIAWLDDDFDSYVTFADNDFRNRIAHGLLNEGGNIVTGTAVDKFIFIAQGSFPDIDKEVDFHHEMFLRNIRVYSLPDGFFWARNPETGNDVLLDSVHIDSVINIVPAQCTIDNRLKVIVDPYYYRKIKDTADFKRFLDQQSISGKDIVVIDERELYLNLPNFSIMLDQAGQKRILFNKEKGYTLPRLHLKAAAMVQPDIEITHMSHLLGSIRCATNMLPVSYTKDGCSLSIKTPDDLSPEKSGEMIEFIQNDVHSMRCLSKLFVLDLAIQINKRAPLWEFDDVTRTAYLYLSADAISDITAYRDGVELLLDDLTKALSARMGISLEA